MEDFVSEWLGIDKILKRIVEGKDIFLVENKEGDEQCVLRVCEKQKIEETTIDETIYLQVGLECPYLVKILKMKNIGKNNLGVLMEYCDDGNLLERIQKGLPTSDEIYRFMYEGAFAIETLHRTGITHHAISPSNFLLKKAIGYKLSDYEVSPSSKKGSINSQGYCSPEILKGMKSYSNKIDIWSFGLTLLHFIIGEHPFNNDRNMAMTGEPISSARNHPHPCAKMALKMIALDPAARPTAADVITGVPPSGAFFRMFFIEHGYVRTKLEAAEDKLRKKKPHVMRKSTQIANSVKPPSSPQSASSFPVMFSKVTQKLNSFFTAPPYSPSSLVPSSPILISSSSSSSLSPFSFSPFSSSASLPSSSSSSASPSSSPVAVLPPSGQSLELIMEHQAKQAPAGFLALPMHIGEPTAATAGGNGSDVGGGGEGPNSSDNSNKDGTGTGTGVDAVNTLNRRMENAPLPLPIYMFPIPKLVPTLAIRTLQHVGVYAEGIFRRSMDMQVLETHMAEVAAGKVATAITTKDPNVYAAVLKTWLRRLPDPLVPSAVYDNAMDFVRDEGEEKVTAHFADYDSFNYYNLNEGDDVTPITVFVDTYLPLTHALLLKYLVRFVRIFTIQPYVATNLMTVDNIALVMAPNILRTKGTMSSLLNNLHLEKKFMMYAICELCVTAAEERLFEFLDASVRKELAVPEESSCSVLGYYTWE